MSIGNLVDDEFTHEYEMMNGHICICDICGTPLTITRGYQQLPACPESLFNRSDGLCCFNTTCRGNCHFHCIDCGDMIYEADAKIPPNSPKNFKKGVYRISSDKYVFQCEDCHKINPVETYPLYPFWGNVKEYVRRYENNMTDTEINYYLSECKYKDPEILEEDEALYQIDMKKNEK